MNFLYYNNDGWVCDRYPYYYPIENENQFIMVSDLIFNKTLKIKPYKAFKIVNNELIECDTDILYPSGFDTEDTIIILKELLKTSKEDVEQVELFGMSRDDYAQKKQQCIDIINKLRELESSIDE